MRTFALTAAAALGVAVVVTAGPTATASPEEVDPSTMTPTLNPTFAPWACSVTGDADHVRGGQA